MWSLASDAVAGRLRLYRTTLLVYILAFTVTIVAENLLMVWIYQHVPDSLVPMVSPI